MKVKILSKSGNTEVESSEQAICSKIYQAIIEQRLLAGTKLGEEALCAAFHVSRSRIRKVLLTLSNRNVVEQRPNKGAYVATPRPQETRHVFEARRSIERTIITRAIERIDKEGIGKLETIIEKGNEYLRSGSRHDAIRLSGQFHLCLAQLSGNHVLQRFLEELVSRTSLIIGMFGTSHEVAYSEGEHEELLQAVIAKDPVKARALMDEHLHAIEASINLPAREKDQVDLKKIFSELKS